MKQRGTVITRKRTDSASFQIAWCDAAQVMDNVTSGSM
jgi:hypothetical protein